MNEMVAVAHCRSFGVAGFWVAGFWVAGFCGSLFAASGLRRLRVSGFWVQGIDEHDVIGQFKHTSHSIQNMLVDYR